MTQRKIIQTNSFGNDVEITLEQFTERWKEHSNQLWKILDPEEFEAFSSMVAVAIVREFNRIYEQQEIQRRKMKEKVHVL